MGADDDLGGVVQHCAFECGVKPRVLLVLREMEKLGLAFLSSPSPPQ